MLIGTPYKWELRESISLKVPASSYIIGYTSNAEVVAKNVFDGSVHVVNIALQRTTAVITGRFPHDIYRCISLDNGRILCSTCGGEIVVFDHKWKYLRTIADGYPYLLMSLGVDGNIVAARYGQCVVQVFKQDDWEMVRSISVRGKPIHQVFGLSSGDIVIRTRCFEHYNCKAVCVLNVSSGYVKSFTCFPDRDVFGLDVDRSRDTIYIIYRDRHHNDWAIDMLPSRGINVAERVLSLDLEVTAMCHPTFTPLGKNHIVIHNDRDGRLQVFIRNIGL